MTPPERFVPRQRPHAPARARVVRALIVVFALAFAFLVGIAFARTLDERPADGGTVTSVRTLTPLQQKGPMRTVTVTVTVTEP